MLAVTIFETVGRDLILGECLSVWKENNENPVRLMTGSCALCFINIIVKYAGMWSKHVYWGQNLFIAWLMFFLSMVVVLIIEDIKSSPYIVISLYSVSSWGRASPSYSSTIRWIVFSDVARKVCLGKISDKYQLKKSSIKYKKCAVFDILMTVTLGVYRLEYFVFYFKIFKSQFNSSMFGSVRCPFTCQRWHFQVC